MTRGQFVRLFLGSDNTAAPSKVIASARQLTLHISLQLESATTKDVTGDWELQEPVAINYEITTNALVRGGENITSQVGAQALQDLETIYKNSTPVKFKVANVSGVNNRTAGSSIISGSVILSQLQINAQVKTNAEYSATLTGYGDFTIG